MPQEKTINTVSRPIKPRPIITPEIRVQRAVNSMKKENPIIPIILSMFEAAINQGPSRENTEIAQIYNRFIVGKIPGEVLEKTIQTFHSLPDSLKNRLDPRRASNINFKPDLSVNLPKITTTVNKAAVGNITTAPVRPTTQIKFDKAFTEAAVRELGKAFLIDDPSPANPVEVPTILSIFPKAGNDAGYTPGEVIKLKVAYPKTESPTFKVILIDKGVKKLIEPFDYATIVPKVLTTGKHSFGAMLQIKLPSDFRGGFVKIQVFSNASAAPVESVKIPIFEKMPPPGPTLVSQAILGSPEITSVSPSTQLPGKKIIIDGHNFGDVTVLNPGKLSNGQPFLKETVLSYNVRAKLVSPVGEDIPLEQISILKHSAANGIGQISGIIPANVIPGNYWLQVELFQNGVDLFPANKKFSAGMTSAVVDYTVRAYKYQVNFDAIHCIDESNPETALGGIFGNPGDEIVTHWAIGVDETIWFKNTGEYTNFDDGDTEKYSVEDRLVYNIDTKGFADVRTVMSLVTNLYESDESDVKRAQGTVALVGKAATEVSKLLTELGVPTAAAIAAAVAGVADAVRVFTGLFGNSDNLGQQEVRWLADDLRKNTDNPQKSFSGKMDFINNDDTGSYFVTYTITRFPE